MKREVEAVNGMRMGQSVIHFLKSISILTEAMKTQKGKSPPLENGIFQGVIRNGNFFMYCRQDSIGLTATCENVDSIWFSKLKKQNNIWIMHSIATCVF